MCGEVVQVYSFVGTAGCEDDFLGLLWHWRRGLRDRKAPDGRLMGIEEEGISKLGFVIRWYCCCDAMEDPIVGPGDNLNCGCSLRGSWCGWLEFLTRYYGRSSIRIAIGAALSFRHVVVSRNFQVGVNTCRRNLGCRKLFCKGLR
jgi:hypothetical protein